MWVFLSFFFSTHAKHFHHCGATEIWMVWLCLLGRGGSRSPGAAEVSDLWQCGSLRSEVRWRVPALSAALCHGHLEPFSFYWPGSQIWPGESCTLTVLMCPFSKFTFPLLTMHLVFVAACEQCYPVLGIGVWKATLQASIWGPEHAH